MFGICVNWLSDRNNSTGAAMLPVGDIIGVSLGVPVFNLSHTTSKAKEGKNTKNKKNKKTKRL